MLFFEKEYFNCASARIVSALLLFRFAQCRKILPLRIAFESDFSCFFRIPLSIHTCFAAFQNSAHRHRLLFLVFAWWTVWKCAPAAFAAVCPKTARCLPIAICNGSFPDTRPQKSSRPRCRFLRWFLAALLRFVFSRITTPAVHDFVQFICGQSRFFRNTAGKCAFSACNSADDIDFAHISLRIRFK